jgi:hypothetical protein
MMVIDNFILGLKTILQSITNITSNFTIGQLLSIIPLIVLLYLIVLNINKRIKNYYDRQLYTIKSNKSKISEDIYNLLSKNKVLKHMINYISDQISILNEYGHVKNRNIATMFLVIMFVIIGVAWIIAFPKHNVVWYLYIFYTILSITIIFIIIYILNFIAKMKFLNRLPITYKLTNSRFMTTRDIVKAIKITIPDYPKPVRREMRKIYSVIRENDYKKLEIEFEGIKNRYKSYYLNLLLDIIQTAKVQGNKDNIIQEQLESLTEEVLDEIENKKDVSSVSKIYILLVIILPFSFPLLEKFVKYTFSVETVPFFETPTAQLFKVVFITFVLIYVSILIMLERS